MSNAFLGFSRPCNKHFFSFTVSNFPTAVYRYFTNEQPRFTSFKWLLYSHAVGEQVTGLENLSDFRLYSSLRTLKHFLGFPQGPSFAGYTEGPRTCFYVQHWSGPHDIHQPPGDGLQMGTSSSSSQEVGFIPAFVGCAHQRPPSLPGSVLGNPSHI